MSDHWTFSSRNKQRQPNTELLFPLLFVLQIPRFSVKPSKSQKWFRQSRWRITMTGVKVYSLSIHQFLGHLKGKQSQPIVYFRNCSLWVLLYRSEMVEKYTSSVECLPSTFSYRYLQRGQWWSSGEQIRLTLIIVWTPNIDQ